MKRFLLISVLVIASIFIVGGLVYNQEIAIKYIYWLPYIWMCIIFFGLKYWQISTAKIFLILHLLVFLAGIFSFVTYEIFKHLDNITGFTSDNYTNVSNLMFNSENALYLMIYSAFLTFIADMVYFLILQKRQQKK